MLLSLPDAYRDCNNPNAGNLSLNTDRVFGIIDMHAGRSVATLPFVACIAFPVHHFRKYFLLLSL
jgi:hypothetical protein